MKISQFSVNVGLVLAFLAFVAQWAIGPNVENIAASCVVLASSLSILLYIKWTDAIRTHPLSTFGIFGFCVTTQLGAMVAQSAAWTSFSEHLQQPLETFTTLAVYQTLALITHAFYRMFFKGDATSHKSLLRGAFEKVGLYAYPTAGTLWMMGWIGFLCFFLGASDDSIGSKLAQGFWFLAWAPFLIPMYLIQLGPTYCRVKKNYTYLFLYMGLIMLYGIAANARGVMLSGVMTVVLFALLTALRSTAKVSVLRVAQLGVLGLVLAAVAIPLSDLATAMVVARKMRGNISATKMIEDTIYYVQQPAVLAATRDKDKVAMLSSSYDEYYFSNPLLGRLMETKFHDNALYFVSRMAQKDQDGITAKTVESMWATLPDPVLNLLGFEIDKKSLKFSMGDYIMHMSSGMPLQGFKTGSVFAQGPAMFGPLFPIVYIVICLLLFITQDLLTRRSVEGSAELSALGMLGIWSLFQYGITAESFQKIFLNLVRGYPQNIVLFLLIFYLARRLTNTLGQVFGSNKSQLRGIAE